MIIMYLHLPVKLLVIKYLTTKSIVVLITSILISYAMHAVFSKFGITRGLLLGSKHDLERFKIYLKKKNVIN